MLPVRRSDAALVRAVLAGRPEAFEPLVLRYQRQAFALVRARGVPLSSAEDVVQDAFLKAFRDLAGLKTPGRFGPWFLQIVRHTSASHVRSSRLARQQEVQPDVPAPEAAGLAERDLGERIRARVQALPEPIREAVFLYYYQGESIAGVARTLGITTVTAKKRLQRGRDALRSELWRELEDVLRDALPSVRGWKTKGRALALAVLISVPLSLRSRVALAAGGAARSAAAAKGAAGTVAWSLLLVAIVWGALAMLPGRPAAPPESVAARREIASPPSPEPPRPAARDAERPTTTTSRDAMASPGLSFLRGDVNDDGRISIADAAALSLWLQGALPELPCREAADADDDGEIADGSAWRCGQLVQVSDVRAILLHGLHDDPCNSDPCRSCLDRIAPPIAAPGHDPTPDDLTCASYSGASPPVRDAAAAIEVLAVPARGGDDALAVLKVRLSHAQPIAGWSLVLDGEGRFSAARGTVDVDGRPSRESFAVLRDGRVHVGVLEAGPRERPEPRGQGYIALKVYLELAPGTPAGEHPLHLIGGELADASAGSAILPRLAVGSLTVERDVARGPRPAGPQSGESRCGVGEAAAPAGPEDVQAAFSLPLVTAERGGRVTVPVWLESNAPVHGFRFAIVYQHGSVRLERAALALPHELVPDAFEPRIVRRPRDGTVQLDDVSGEVVLGRGEPAAALPAGMRHHLLDLDFTVDADAPPGQSLVRLEGSLAGHPETPDRAQATTEVRAFGRFLRSGVVTCLDLGRDGGIVVPHPDRSFLRGDANQDGAVSLADAVSICHQLGKWGRLPCEDAGDADDDGRILITDAIRIFNRVFRTPQAVPPPPPALEPSVDPTADALPCERYEVAPAGPTGDELRIGSLVAAPGEEVEVPILATLSRPLAAYQLVIGYDPAVFVPGTMRKGKLRLDRTAFEGAKGGLRHVGADDQAGCLEVGFIPDFFKPRTAPAGRDVLVGMLTGRVAEGAPVGAVVRFAPLPHVAGESAAPDRLRTEIVEEWDGRLVALLPRLEAGTLRVAAREDAAFVRGDADLDERVGIGDALVLLRHLLLGHAPPACADAADLDDDGRLALGDAVALFCHLFLGTAAIPPPAGVPGFDPTPDELRCRPRR